MSAILTAQEPLDYEAATVAGMEWVARIVADDLATGAITTIPSGGTASEFTGTGTVTASATGFNGHKAITLNGSSDNFVASTGGASLASDWYVGLVVRPANLSSGGQTFVQFGDSTANENRIFRTDQFGRIGFNNGSSNYVSDSAFTPALTNNTVYFLEIVTKSGATKFFINGIEYEATRQTLSAFTDTEINLFWNGSSERFNGTVGELFILPSIPATEEWRVIRRHVAATYGITMAAATASLQPSLTIGSGTISNGAFVGDDSIAAFGNYGVLLTGSTTSGYIYSADLSVNGSFAAYVGANEHDLSNYWSGQNVLNIRNKCKSGFSAIRYSHPIAGEEGAAMGLSSGETGTIPWGEPGYGGAFLEGSNFKAGQTGEWGSWRLIQSMADGIKVAVRNEARRDTGDIVWYTRVGVTGPGTSEATLLTYRQMVLGNTTGNLTLLQGGYAGAEQASPPSAPASNGYIIYAEDNGSGKTRLMVRFATGASQQLAIEP